MTHTVRTGSVSPAPHRRCPSPVPHRVFGMLLALGPCSLGSAQLPAAAPSGPPSNPAAVTAHPPRHSEITFTNGLLAVNATNASLNIILREIARQTGMKITGSVAEDRVFGIYGPADPQKVLATLLDGTGSNFLILSSNQDVPVQLVLTARTGSPTPPNPDAMKASEGEDDQAAGVPNRLRGPRRGSPVLPGSVPAPPAAAAQPSSDETVVFPRVNASSSPTTGTTSQPDPENPDDPSNSVKTPQQIFEQLQRLRQPPSASSDPQ